MRLKCERRRYDSEHILRNITQEEHGATLVYHEDSLKSWWIHLSPGVTGYESVSVENLLQETKPKGWFANVGTPGSYDELYVLPDEMERLKDFLRLVKGLLVPRKDKL